MRHVRRIVVVAVAIATATGALVAQPASVAPIMKDAAIAAALDDIRATDPQTIAEQVRFCEVPAPPFQEEARAALLRRAFLDAGLEQVRVDEAGNVLGEHRGTAPRPRLVVASHLDTVFPKETAVKVSRQGNVL